MHSQNCIDGIRACFNRSLQFIWRSTNTWPRDLFFTKMGRNNESITDKWINCVCTMSLELPFFNLFFFPIYSWYVIKVTLHPPSSCSYRTHGGIPFGISVIIQNRVGWVESDSHFRFMMSTGLRKTLLQSDKRLNLSVACRCVECKMYRDLEGFFLHFVQRNLKMPI